jgi:hypothetical protein
MSSTRLSRDDNNLLKECDADGTVAVPDNMKTNVSIRLFRSHVMWQLLLYLPTHGGIVERLKRVLGVQSGKLTTNCQNIQRLR